VRSEDEWDETPVTATVGSASVTESGPTSTVDFAAVLWVPDPEQRHGWREFYIRRDQKPNGKAIGFKR
jgi:hypothetical protein